MDTKKRILEISLQVFNENGFRKTTTRHIAEKMGISPGNLHYHYKHTEDIIIALVDELVSNADLLMLNLKNQEKSISIDVLLNLSQGLYYLQKRYRFIFINIVELSLWIPPIRVSYESVINKRKMEVKDYFNNMIEKGLFRNDLSVDMWDYIVDNIIIVFDFWISYNFLNGKPEGPEAMGNYIKTIEALIYPYRK